ATGYGRATAAAICPPRRPSRSRGWRRTHGASSRSARSRSPTPRRADDPRLRRARRNGRAHGEAASRRRSPRDRLQPHARKGALARRRRVAPGGLTARGRRAGRRRLYDGDRLAGPRRGLPRSGRHPRGAPARRRARRDEHGEPGGGTDPGRRGRDAGRPPPRRAGVLLAEKAGIARERAVEALLKSVLASPMVKYRGPFVLGMPAEAWFDVGMMQKDLKLALDLGRTTGVPLPSVAVANELLTAARGMELGRYDFAVVFDVLAAMSGLAPSAKA